MLGLGADYLHSSMVLSCIAKCYCNRAHLYLFLVLYNQNTSLNIAFTSGGISDALMIIYKLVSERRNLMVP